MLRLEPMPKQAFPKDLRMLPDAAASEIYRYRAVQRGEARIFFTEYKESLRAKHGKKAAFSVPEIINFFAKAAAAGVIGNLAYLVLVNAVNAIRKPNQEITGKGFRFEAVISRRTYNRLRRAERSDKRPSRTIPPKLEEKLETEYRLIVKLKRSQ